MAQVVTRVNLSANMFPLLSELSGKSIIVKQTDQNYVAQITSQKDTDKDVGVPQLYYGHNIIATGQGYQSIGFDSKVQGIAGVNTVVGIFSVQDDSGNKRYIAYTSEGTLYYSSDPYYSWTLLAAMPTTAGKLVTTAYVNGVTYIFFATIGCYSFNFTTNTLTSVTLTGLTVANILGITACYGYMLAWALNSLAWSSTVTPTDFTPSLITGAGGGAVQAAKGGILFVLPHTIGFVIYTNSNAVAAIYSGNSKYPFTFKEIVASGGLGQVDLATYDANSGNHYVYTTSGLQLMSLQQSQTVFPEITDFVAGSIFEDYDEVTDTFSTETLTTTMQKSLVCISDRYLVLSYGKSSLTHAIIYDLALQRMGKIKLPHVQCFEFNLLTPETTETPRHSLAFLQDDGAVYIVNMSTNNSQSAGVALFGKYQYIRQRMVQLQSVEVENIRQGQVFSCIALQQLDGKNSVNYSGFLKHSQGLARKYLFNVVGQNVSFIFKGAFNLVSLVLSYNVHGRR